MDKFNSRTGSPCLFCLTPVERSSKVNMNLKKNNYQDIVGCSRNYLEDKINGQYAESVCRPDQHLAPLCLKCFKSAENIYKINGQLMELSKMLEELIEKSSLEINERISRLASDGYLLTNDIKVEGINDESDVVGEELSDNHASETLENTDRYKSYFSNESNFNISDEQDVLSVINSNDKRIESVFVPPMDFNHGEWDETDVDVDPLEPGRTADVDEEGERSNLPSILLKTCSIDTVQTCSLDVVLQVNSDVIKESALKRQAVEDLSRLTIKIRRVDVPSSSRVLASNPSRLSPSNVVAADFGLSVGLSNPLVSPMVSESKKLSPIDIVVFSVRPLGPCAFCGGSHTNKSARHRCKVKAGPRFVCDLCGTQLSRRDALTRHRAVSHGLPANVRPRHR